MNKPTRMTVNRPKTPLRINEGFLLRIAIFVLHAIAIYTLLQRECIAHTIISVKPNVTIDKAQQHALECAIDPGTD